jgi:hypothetical protein
MGFIFNVKFNMKLFVKRFKIWIEINCFFADKLFNSSFNLLLALWNEINLIHTGR